MWAQTKTSLHGRPGPAGGARGPPRSGLRPGAGAPGAAGGNSCSNLVFSSRSAIPWKPLLCPHCSIIVVYIDFITPYIDFIFCLSIVVCLYIYVYVEYVPTHICNPLLRNCVFSLFCFCLVKEAQYNSEALSHFSCESKVVKSCEWPKKSQEIFKYYILLFLHVFGEKTHPPAFSLPSQTLWILQVIVLQTVIQCPIGNYPHYSWIPFLQIHLLANLRLYPKFDPKMNDDLHLHPYPSPSVAELIFISSCLSQAGCGCFLLSKQGCCRNVHKSIPVTGLVYCGTNKKKKYHGK